MAKQLSNLFFDLDGTLINTNMNKEGSAKWLESLEIVTEITQNNNLEKFRDFYLRFNKQALGMHMDDASRLFSGMLNEEYGVKISEKEFIPYRRKKRIDSYRNHVKFIGNGEIHNGIWLGNLPYNLQEKSWLVTISPKNVVSNLNLNPNLLVNRKTLNDFFKERIITCDDVICKKPDPEAYNIAMERARAIPNKYGFSGIAFEDGLSGVISAREAEYAGGRLYVVGIETNNSSEELKKQGAHYTTLALHSIDLISLLKKAGFT